MDSIDAWSPTDVAPTCPMAEAVQRINKTKNAIFIVPPSTGKCNHHAILSGCIGSTYESPDRGGASLCIFVEGNAMAQKPLQARESRKASQRGRRALRDGSRGVYVSIQTLPSSGETESSAC